MPAAADHLRARRIVPSDLRSKEWTRADAWVRERAFFKASVDRAEQLERFRAVETAVASGQMGAGQAREAMRRYLQASGYEAPEGLRGTIKDLSTAQRLQVSIDTDVAMARGWAQRQQMLGDITNPGQRLYRARASREPRDWAQLWSEAAASVNHEGVARDGSMIALITSPVWIALSDFGNAYPPYKWGSGMSVMPVSFEDCERAGLVNDKMFEDIDKARLDSLNANVEMTPQVGERALRDALAETLEGIAEWRGDKLVLTDPNGSRPYAWDEIGGVISTPNKAGVPLYQAQAFRDWIADNWRFDPKHGTVGLDEREDLIRLFSRIKPDASGTPIYRAMRMDSQNELDLFDSAVRANGYQTKPGKIADSWSPSTHNAEQYAKGADYQVILQCSKYKSRKRIDGIYSYVTSEQQDTAHPVKIEGESVFLNGVRFRVLGRDKIRTKKGYRYVYEVEEI